MSDGPSLQDLLEVQKHFGLPSPALVEKDWYVVKALAALVAVDAAPFRLVFGGGTALSRAHRLIRRMSEDIDLKIISDTTVTRPALRHLRDIITKALLQFDPENPRHRESGNASRHTLYRLPYAPIMAGEGTLRPEIKIETAVWPLRRPAVVRSVSSFVPAALEALEVADEMCSCIRFDLEPPLRGVGEILTRERLRRAASERHQAFTSVTLGAEIVSLRRVAACNSSDPFRFARSRLGCILIIGPGNLPVNEFAALVISNETSVGGQSRCGHIVAQFEC